MAPTRERSLSPTPFARVRAAVPARMGAGAERLVDVEVTNAGQPVLSSAGEEPVQLGTRWFAEGFAEPVAEGPRSQLLGSLRAGASQVRPLRVVAPPSPGRYVLRVAAVREHVAWCDDLDPSAGAVQAVEVLPDQGPSPVLAGELPGLEEMTAEVAAVDALLGPSAFWRDLASYHLALLERTGYAHFKRTVTLHYFQWMPFSGGADQVLAALRSWVRHPRPGVLLARAAGGSVETVGRQRLYGPADRAVYAWFVAALWEHARRRDRRGLVDRLEEPPVGNPLTVRHRRRSISQDLVNSALELMSILDGLPGGLPAGATVLETGAGYGRLAWALGTTHPGVRIVVADVPPALALAQRYLTETLPGRRVFRFRRSSELAAAADELAAADLVFLTPNQLELIEPLGARLGVNVSSLHELRPEQIARSLELLDRHVDGFFYSKQWERWRNPVDGVETSRTSYPYPARWTTVFERRHPIQRGFFETLRRTRASH